LYDGRGALIDIGGAPRFLRELRLGQYDGDDLPEAVVEQKLDHIVLFHRRRRLDPLAVDLDVAPAAGLRRLFPVLEETDELQPVVDPVAFHRKQL